MSIKNTSLILWGALGLIIFGFLIPQPIQALLVLVESPVKDFLFSHPFFLCIIVGLIQGISEETGFFYIFKTRLKENRDIMTPILVGVGRGGLEFIFNLVMALTANHSLAYFAFLIIIRLTISSAAIGLCYLDYSAAQGGNSKYLLVIPVVLHMMINAGIYALEQGFISIRSLTPDLYALMVSIITILIALIVHKKRVTGN